MVRKSTIAKSVQTVYDRAGALPTGVEGANVPSDFFIAPVGIEDVDRAVFDLFEKKIKLDLTINNKNVSVPTVFAGGERVFLSKNNKPPRDRTGAYILPIVSIKRTGLDQSRPGEPSGRGMGQNTGDIIIKKRLSDRDAKYQSLLNSLNIQHQDNVASIGNRQNEDNPIGSRVGTIATRRKQSTSFNTWTGELLAPSLGKNIFEIITVPFPLFYVAKYKIVFWTQYVQHMNILLQRFMTSYDGQGTQFKLDTPKGYWFVGYVDNDLSSADNFENYTEEERFVKYEFTMSVPAYLHAAERHGSGIPVRSFLSAPQISFQIISGGPPVTKPKGAPVGSGDINKFTLNNIDRLDKRGDLVYDEKQETEFVEEAVTDPFNTNNDKRRLVRVISRNMRKGETVTSKRTLKIIDEVNG